LAYIIILQSLAPSPTAKVLFPVSLTIFTTSAFCPGVTLHKIVESALIIIFANKALFSLKSIFDPSAITLKFFYLKTRA
jgi:hypothetical protein